MDGGLSGELDPELEAPWPCDACFARLYLDVCEPCSRNGACACASAPACASAAAASAHAQPMPTGGLAGDAHAVPAVCKEELPWNAGVPAYARGFPDEPKYDFFSDGLGPLSDSCGLDRAFGDHVFGDEHDVMERDASTPGNLSPLYMPKNDHAVSASPAEDFFLRQPPQSMLNRPDFMDTGFQFPSEADGMEDATPCIPEANPRRVSPRIRNTSPNTTKNGAAETTRPARMAASRTRKGATGIAANHKVISKKAAPKPRPKNYETGARIPYSVVEKRAIQMIVLEPRFTCKPSLEFPCGIMWSVMVEAILAEGEAGEWAMFLRRLRNCTSTVPSDKAKTLSKKFFQTKEGIVRRREAELKENRRFR